MTPQKTKTSRKSPELDTLSPFAREIADGLLDAAAHLEGKPAKVRVTEIELPDPAPTYSATRVKALRQRLGLTQRSFAQLLNVTVKSVEGWESGAKKPGSSTRRLLQLTEDKKALAALAQITSQSGGEKTRHRKPSPPHHPKSD